MKKQFIYSFLVFPSNDLRQDPAAYVYNSPEYLGTLRYMERLSQAEEEQLRDLLSHIKNYYSKRNIDVLTNFRDFDRNNIGTVTESQVKIEFTKKKNFYLNYYSGKNFSHVLVSSNFGRFADRTLSNRHFGQEVPSARYVESDQLFELLQRVQNKR